MEARSIRVLVVEDDRNYRETLRSLFSLESWIELVGIASSVRETVAMACQLNPDVILMDYFLPDGNGAQITERLSSLLPSTAVIVMSVESSPEVIRGAMLAGAKDFLQKPFGATELFGSLDRAVKLQPSAAEDSSPVAQHEGAEIITVYSPKGGCGVTSLAVNLAVAKRLETGARVAAVDLSLPYGNMGLLLDLAAPSNIYDLCMKVNDLDAALLSDVMVPHTSGVKALLSPGSPQQSEAVGSSQVRKVLGEMVNHFDYLFIDTSHGLGEVVLMALDMARSVILVTNQDVATVRNTKQFLDVARLLDYPDSKIKLVLNRVNSYSALSVDSIAKRLGLPMFGAVPEELKAFSDASNNGVPVVIGAKNGPAARELRRVAGALSSVDASSRARPGDESGKAGRKPVFRLFAKA